MCILHLVVFNANAVKRSLSQYFGLAIDHCVIVAGRGYAIKAAPEDMMNFKMVVSTLFMMMLNACMIYECLMDRVQHRGR